MSRDRRHSVSQRDPSTVRNHHSYRYDEREKRFSSTFLIVLVSLLFVAVFGGALVGGVVSGDPSNGFFITIIAASGVAISIAAIVSLRYCWQQRKDSHQRDYAMKENVAPDVRGTFTQSHEEDDEEMGYYENRRRYYPTQGRVEERIQEVDARSMAPGDISAMSPTTYDMDSYAQTASQFTRSEYNGNGYRPAIAHVQQREERRSPFDFTAVETPGRQDIPIREDPPEDHVGCNLYCGIPISKDPAAAVATADGNLYVIEDPDDDEKSQVSNTPSNQSEISRYDVPEDEEPSVNSTDRQTEITEASKSPRKRESSTSPHHERTSKEINDFSIVPPPPPPRPAKLSSVKSSGRDTLSSRAMPGTPSASDAGTSVSSTILRQFAGMFGKKRTTSEAGYSDDSSVIKSSAGKPQASAMKQSVSDSENVSGNEGRPPIPGKKKSSKRSNLSTNGRKRSSDRYALSATGEKSAFAVPPPRRIPSTPASEAPSEFRSVAASSVFSNGVASSTFDPGARDRAIRRSQRNASALGASFGDMPIYYDDDESAIQSGIQSAVQSATQSVAPSAASSEPTEHSIGYDVFAPPGPIGMVVDTVEQGCVVHSLKKTSPMQGLINPGDLIVALDDIDVRKLDAAALTKLMAKKSQQKERKFTLIPADQY